MLPGHVEARLVRCGKKGCKCSRGEPHGPYFYHLTWDGGRRSKTYVRLSDLAGVLNACEAHRELQSQLRSGRANYRNMLGRLRELLPLLEGARKAGW